MSGDTRTFKGDHLAILHGQIIGIPRLVELLEHGKAQDIADLVAGIMETPGVCLSNAYESNQVGESLGGELLVTVSVDKKHISIADGTAITGDSDLIRVPDEIEILTPTTNHHIDVLIVDTKGRSVAPNLGDLFWVQLEYVETIDPSKNVPYHKDWVNNGEAYKMKSYRVHFCDGGTIFFQTSPHEDWIVIARLQCIQGSPSTDLWSVEDRRTDNLFTIKPNVSPPEVPVKPKVWLNTGLDTALIPENININASSMTGNLAWLTVMWGDTGRGTLVAAGGNKIFTDNQLPNEKKWPVNEFAGQYITLVGYPYKLRVLSSTAFSEPSTRCTVTLDPSDPHFSSVPAGDYDYFIGPHADEYTVSMTLVDKDSNIFNLPNDQFRIITASQEEMVLSQPLGTMFSNKVLTRMYQYYGGLQPGVKVRVQVIARNRRISTRETVSDAVTMTVAVDAFVGSIKCVDFIEALSEPYKGLIQLTTGYSGDAQDWIDLDSFEIYCASSTAYNNPFLNGSGDIDITKLTPDKLIAKDKILTHQRLVTKAEVDAGTYYFFVARAISKSGVLDPGKTCAVKVEDLQPINIMGVYASTGMWQDHMSDKFDDSPVS